MRKQVVRGRTSRDGKAACELPCPAREQRGLLLCRPRILVQMRLFYCDLWTRHRVVYEVRWDWAEDSCTAGCPLRVLILPRPPSRYINRAFVCCVSSQCVSTIKVQGLPSPPHTTLLLSVSEGSKETNSKHHSQILCIPTESGLSGTAAEAQVEYSGARAEILTGMLCHHHSRINTVK